MREPADAAARSTELVDVLRSRLRPGRTTVHDLGCGTGSMARWLAEQLPGPQRWIEYDRDVDLLRLAAAASPTAAADGAAVTVDTRRRDITLLTRLELERADLVTASALLDMLTEAELERMIALCAGAGCPVLITLSVTGSVELSPADPLDQRIVEAFNSHQRRLTGSGRLLGPDAVHRAAEDFARRGLEVLVRPSPWRLGPEDVSLTERWLAGWLGAACEQQPDLRGPVQAYAGRRKSEMARGRLRVVVHHLDLLALPAR